MKDNDMHKNLSIILNNKFQIALVSKCGNTTLKSIYYFQKCHKWNKSISIHHIINLENFTAFKIDYDCQEYKKIAIFRDPIERLISVYKDKIIKDKCFYYHYKGYDIKQDISIKDFIQFASNELKKEISKQDEHIRLQSSCYEYEKIDEFVSLDKLDEWLIKNEIFKEKIHLNETDNSKIILDEDDLKKIKSLYNDDYEMIKKIENKIFK